MTGTIGTGAADIIGVDINDISDDDQTLIDQKNNNINHQRDETNATNITVTYNIIDDEIVALEQCNDGNETDEAVAEEQKDFFPSPHEIYSDIKKNNKLGHGGHGSSKSLLDELGQEL